MMNSKTIFLEMNNEMIVNNEFNKNNLKNESLSKITTSFLINDLNIKNKSSLYESIDDLLYESDHWDEENSLNNAFNEKILYKKIWNDNLEKSCAKCNYIENNIEFLNMIKCEGYCRKPYHLKCVGLNFIPSERWKCEYCIKGLVYCNICNSFDNKKNKGFLKCYHPLCMRFFHTYCLFNNKDLGSKIIWTFKDPNIQQNSLISKNEIIIGQIKNDLFNKENNYNINDINFTKLLLKKYNFKFICSRHFCLVCDKRMKDYLKNIRNEKIENLFKYKRFSTKLEDPEKLFYCIKCNTGYHNHCLHPDSIKIGNGICICYKHIHEDNNLLLKNYDIKKILKLNKFDILSKNIVNIKLNKKLEILNIIKDYIISKDYNINSYSFELPNQSKNWEYDDIKKYISNKQNNYFEDYIQIKKNIYIDDSDIDSIIDLDENKLNKKTNIKKKKLFLINKKQIIGEKCTCKIICERDTCQNAAIYVECNSSICGLDEKIQNINCMNRLFNSNFNKIIDNEKNKILKNLKVFNTGEKGLGVCCNILIPKDTFIIEYVGEILTKKKYLERAEKYKEIEIEYQKKYLLDFDDIDLNEYNLEFKTNFNKNRRIHWYFMEVGNEYVIDSTRKGNISRLINHSCEPNCVAQKWIVGNEYRIGIFSLKDIEPNEELTYNYSFNAYDIGFKCKCNSKYCKGRIGIENFKEINNELIKKRNSLCKNTNFLNNFISLNRSLLNNPLLNEIEIEYSLINYYENNKILYEKILKDFFRNNNNNNNNNNILNLLKYSEILSKHIIEDIEIHPYDFKYRNSLYGYSCLLYFDSPFIIDWYIKKSKNLLLMEKPWIILPFMLNNFEYKILNNKLMNIYNLKNYIFKRASINIDIIINNLSDKSLFWYLFDTGVGSDECCNICKNPGTLITCDYCYNSFHEYCLYNKEIINNLKRSRLSYNYKIQDKRIIRCKSCLEDEFYSIYWTKTSYKKRRINYFLRHRIYSLPFFMNILSK